MSISLICIYIYIIHRYSNRHIKFHSTPTHPPPTGARAASWATWGATLRPVRWQGPMRRPAGTGSRALEIHRQILGHGFLPWGKPWENIWGIWTIYIYYIYDICLVSGIWTSGVFLFNVFMENDILMMLYNNGFQLRMVWNEAFICQSWTARWRMSAPGTPPIWMRNDDGKPVFIMWPAGCLRTSWKAVDWNCFPDVALRPKFQTQ